MTSQQARSRKKKREDRQTQEKYFNEHPFCEVCIHEGRGKIPAVEVHEILFRSRGGKCEEDNMISVDRDDHMRCHFLRETWLYRKDLYKIKGVENGK